MDRVNVYGSFAEALLFSGSVAVPKYLLTHYVQLGLTEQHMMLIIHILSEAQAHLTTDLLANRMGMGRVQVEEMLAYLQERGFLQQEKNRREGGARSKRYTIVGLLDELAECWAIERMKELTEEGQDHVSSTLTGNEQTAVRLLTLFEQELGRPLTEFECDHVRHWLNSNFSEELIIEALRRGVSAGIRTFRYLDSILREWEKKGLRNKAAVAADDADFQARQSGKAKIKGRPERRTRPDKYENLYL